jgi:hypothetical protein
MTVTATKGHGMKKLAAALIAFFLMLGILPLGANARGPEGCDTRRAVRAESGRTPATIEFESVGPRGRERHGDRIQGDARSLSVVVEWKHLEDVHAQRLALYAPDGSLFRRFTTTFAAHGKQTDVTSTLPVVGSAISDAGLFGEWCAEVFLDDDATPVVAKSFEVLKPHHH